MSIVTQDTPHGTSPTGVRLAWPPPGLEPLHDTLWPAVDIFSVGALVFTLPLLVAVGIETPFHSLGPFGYSWWIPLAAAFIGFVVLLAGAIRLNALLQHCARGAALGYPAWILAAVAADRTRDTGFVVQGMRGYDVVSETDRRRLVTLRTTAPLAYLVAAMWLPAGIVLSGFAATSAWIGATGIWVFTLAPTVLCWIVGLAVGVLARSLLRGSRRGAAASADAAAAEADAWIRGLALLTSEPVPARHIPPRTLRVCGRLAIVPALLLLIAVGAIAGAMALGPLLVSFGMPRFSTLEARAAAVAPLQAYRLEAGQVPADEAGRAFHSLMFVGSTDVPEMMQPPARSYPEGWFAGEGRESLGTPARWPVELFGVELFGRVQAGLAPHELAFLAAVAAHPAHAEFALLARARQADIAGARWPDPLDGVIWAGLAIPLFGGLIRSGSDASVGKAAYELATGNAARAELTLREVISTGLLLMEEGPTVLDAIKGIDIAYKGASALERFYSVTGRTAEAERLAAELTTGQAVADALRRRPQAGASTALNQITNEVLDDNALRAMRWEQFATISTLAPCLNLYQAVVRRDTRFREWQAQVETALVRHPGEARLFNLVRNGVFTPGGEPPYRCGLPLSVVLRDL
jgi:hypothetical protein